MTDAVAFRAIPSSTLAEILSREHVMQPGIRPIWAGMPRIAGVAYPVRCAPGDNLMLHAAIYRAAPGSIIVAMAGDLDYALAGGNVCAVAQSQNISGFIIDGTVRDVAEVRSLGFPVFARGVVPTPGKQCRMDILNGPVQCGGVWVAPGDLIVADEDGIIVVQQSAIDDVFARASARVAKEQGLSLETWKAAHRERIESILQSQGYFDESPVALVK